MNFMLKTITLILLMPLVIYLFLHYNPSMRTINYYNNNAQAFYDRTISVDLSSDYHKFLSLLHTKAHILDAGCGVGRDAKYFKNQRYIVTAFDPSQEMVKLATIESSVEILQMSFQDMNFTQEFDGVWASLSLIHVSYAETQDVYKKIHRALKPGGIFYASYKYGSTHMYSAERDFWNMDEIKLLPYLDGLFEIVDLWKVKDTRSKVSPSPNQMILHFIAKKR